MNVVASLCHRFPEAALMARRLLDKGGKRAAETKPRKGHEFDPAKLVHYLATTLGAPSDPAKIKLGQFSHGQSNPTFTVRWDNRAVVVRKQPGGKLLKGAHDVGREHAFASYLKPLGVPAPTALALCDDIDILGTRFWVYDFVEGRHFRDPYLERAPVAERPQLYKNAARAAATLHSAAPPAELVTALGGPPKAGYLSRQVKTWTKQYNGADEKLGLTTDARVVAHAQRLSQACATHSEDVAGDVDLLCVAHGDFRCDNLIYDDSGNVEAILDWELATLGHPLADVAYLGMPYQIPPFVVGPLSGFRGLRDMEGRHGVPPLEVLVNAYADALKEQDRGADVAKLCRAGLPYFDLFSSVGYFRIASICRGVYARAKAGTASSANAAAVGALADTLLDVSVRLAGDHAAVVGGTRAPLKAFAD